MLFWYALCCCGASNSINRPYRGLELSAIQPEQKAECENTYSALVQNSVETLIEDHLTQFALHGRQRETNLVGNVLNLNARERLDDAQQILLKQRVVKLIKVGLQEGVLNDMLVRRGGLERAQRTLLAGCGNAAHRVQCGTTILKRKLALQNASDILGLEDRCEQHNERQCNNSNKMWGRK